MATTEIKLPDSGATIRVKRISPMTLMAIERAHPDPKPPMQEVDYGNGSKRLEANPLDPQYQLELAAHQQTRSMLLLQALVRFGVEVDVDAAKVAAYREDMATLGGTLPPDDKYVYVAHVLCETNADLVALREAVMGTSVPSERAVAEKQATFPGDVQGPEHLGLEGAAVGGDV